MPYLVMEYVRGRDLASVLDHEGPLPFVRAAPILAQICGALSEAHELGVVHRDLKPENILLTRTQRGNDFIKVLDFGLAKLGEREELAEKSDGAIIGTPYFMSPEQIRGETIDARSDIYSMGALAYRLLTGEPPFRAKTPVGVLTKHLTEPVVPPSERRPELEIHPAVDELVGRALAKRPEERYESTGALLDALEAAFLQCQAGLGDTGRQHPLAGWASGMTTTPLPDDIDYGLATGLRLRRSDFDAFERGLRRRRRIGLAAVPALLLGGSALFAYRMLFSASAPLSRERESNDRLELANPIAAGSEVRGHIGKRISQSEPDRDFYRPAEPPAGNVATAQLSGLPNMDLALSLHDLSGRLLVTANEGEIGAGESIWRHRVTGPFTVQVTQVMAADPRALPVENVSDEYRLVLHLSPVDPRLESEPNDSAADALSLAAATPITGRLDRRDDVDCFRFAGAAGRYRVQLSGTPGWTVLWRLPGEKPQLPGGSAALAPGDVIEILGGQRPVARPLAERSYTLELQPQPAGP